MKATRPRLRGKVAGLAAALALAAGGAAAAFAGTVTHAPAAPAEHAAGTHHRALAVEAKASLLRYLKKNRAWNIPAPGGGPHKVTPSTTNLGVSAGGTATQDSYNWSGYFDSGATGTFTLVSANWAQPTTLCTAEQRLAAFWVGLDGALTSDQTVEQVGTLSYCFEGQAYYYTWWELFPGSSITVGSTVQPGDLISASVSRSGTSYTLSLTDSTTPGNSFSTTQTCAANVCLDQSAEWVAERPAFPIGITPLSYFNDWAPFNASETANGTKGSIASGPGATSVTMVDATDTYPLDSVSALSSGGASFTANWLDSY